MRATIIVVLMAAVCATSMAQSDSNPLLAALQALEQKLIAALSPAAQQLLSSWGIGLSLTNPSSSMTNCANIAPTVELENFIQQTPSCSNYNNWRQLLKNAVCQASNGAIAAVSVNGGATKISVCGGCSVPVAQTNYCTLNKQTSRLCSIYSNVIVYRCVCLPAATAAPPAVTAAPPAETAAPPAETAAPPAATLPPATSPPVTTTAPQY